MKVVFFVGATNVSHSAKAGLGLALFSRGWVCPHSDPIAQRQPLSAAVLPFPSESYLVAAFFNRHGGTRLLLCEAPDVAVNVCAVVRVVTSAVEHAREVAALGLVVAHNLGTFERVRIPAVQHEEAAGQLFVAFVADPRYARRTRVGGLLPSSAVRRSFGMPSFYEGLKAFVRGRGFRLLEFGCARHEFVPFGLIEG